MSFAEESEPIVAKYVGDKGIEAKNLGSMFIAETQILPAQTPGM